MIPPISRREPRPLHLETDAPTAPKETDRKQPAPKEPGPTQPVDGVDAAPSALSKRLFEKQDVSGDAEAIKKSLSYAWNDWAITDGDIGDVHKRVSEVVDDPRRDANQLIDKLSDQDLERWRDNVDADSPESRALLDKLMGEVDVAHATRLGKVFGLDKVAESMAAHGSPTAKREMLESLASKATTEPKLHTEVVTTVRTVGNEEAHAAVKLLQGMAERAGKPGHEQAANVDELNRAVKNLRDSGKLDTLATVALGETWQTHAQGMPVPNVIPDIRFKADPLVRIIDGVGKSGDTEAKKAILAAGAKGLHQVEFTAEEYQKAELIKFPAAVEISSAMYRLMGVPAADPAWTPPADGGEDTGAASHYDGDNGGDALRGLGSRKDVVQGAAAHYNVDPRAIAAVTYVEAEHNNGLTRKLGLGRGEGFGQMHNGAVEAIHPDWNEDQIDGARKDARYAPGLIAADMDLKARIFEFMTDGQVSIRNNPTALAWAFNNPISAVVSKAQTAAADASHDRPQIELDFSGSTEIEPHGMAGWAKKALESGKLDDFAPPRPLASSPQPYEVHTA